MKRNSQSLGRQSRICSRCTVRVRICWDRKLAIQSTNLVFEYMESPVYESSDLPCHSQCRTYRVFIITEHIVTLVLAAAVFRTVVVCTSDCRGIIVLLSSQCAFSHAVTLPLQHQSPSAPLQPLWIVGFSHSCKTPWANR